MNYNVGWCTWQNGMYYACIKHTAYLDLATDSGVLDILYMYMYMYDKSELL